MGRHLWMVAIGFLMMAALPAVAADDPPCVADVKKLCADTPAGGGRIQACLKANESKLSAPCRARVDDLMKEMGSIAATCQYDTMRFCDHVIPGGGRLAKCLQDHTDDLSPECKDRLAKAK